jgi:Baseplate J-like protein
MTQPANRDYTRWNRANLKSFSYVDGNAATYLEDVKSAMRAQFYRGEQTERNTVAYWNALLSNPLAEETIADIEKFSAWPSLLPILPPLPENNVERNKRLLTAYLAQSPDYAEEIMRAFARAAHVLLGHANAYANEGYLRTATQWETARKLAAMAGYQPASPAAATVTLALVAREGVSGNEVQPGLQMSAKRRDGKPLVFETIEPLRVHHLLNDVRIAGWNFNSRNVDMVSGIWLTVSDKLPRVAEIAVLQNAAEIKAVTVSNVVPHSEKNKVTLGLTGATGSFKKGETRLYRSPALVAVGEPTTGVSAVHHVSNAAAFEVGGIALVSSGITRFPVTITKVDPPYVFTDGNIDVLGSFDLMPLTRLARSTSSSVAVVSSVARIYKYHNGALAIHERGTHTTEIKNNNDVTVFHDYELSPQDSSYAWAEMPGTHAIKSNLVRPPVIAGQLPANTVKFKGKAPKELAIGAVYAARAGGSIHALTVKAVQSNADSYSIAFAETLPGPREQTEFHGPMTEVLRPDDWNRNPDTVRLVGGRLQFEYLTDEAKTLLRLGRRIIVEDERPDHQVPALLTCEGVTEDGMAFLDAAKLAGYETGWTRFRMNCVKVSHGEDLGPRILGSGDGSKKRQSFPLPVQDISFIPSTLSETGTVPAIDVRVNDELWDYRDFMDLDAEETRTYSSEPQDDGTLLIHFRRRLPTGTNNVTLTRHRIGAGPDGNLIAPYSFKKPEHKHEAVVGIVQPFSPTGGAERERTSDMRINAPARLAANGRAVSVEDYARLVRRHASVWQARADYVALPQGGRNVQVVVVPANYTGQPNTASYYEELREFLVSRHAPDMPFDVTEFSPVAVEIAATIRVNSHRFDREKVKEASISTLLTTFGLAQRKLGQPLYVGEILASLETVDGLESALASFDVLLPANGRQKASAASGLSAYFSTKKEVAYLKPGAVSILVEEPT